jgi:hypothetical protein
MSLISFVPIHFVFRIENLRMKNATKSASNCLNSDVHTLEAEGTRIQKHAKLSVPISCQIAGSHFSAKKKFCLCSKPSKGHSRLQHERVGHTQPGDDGEREREERAVKSAAHRKQSVRGSEWKAQSGRLIANVCRDREIFTHRALAQQTARGPKRKLLKQTETDREPD